MASFSRIGLFLSVLSVTVLFSRPAHAMHIAEGILPWPWAVLWYALSIPFIALGLRSLRRRSETEPYLKSFVALVGAGVFVVSCMPVPVPIAGTCSHPCGTGIAAILIGPALSVVVASIALVLQALFLAHGGLTTLGANVFAMGVVGSYAGYGAFLFARRLGASFAVAAFMAGLFADWATYAATSCTLAAGLQSSASTFTMLASILIAFMPTQIPLGILEGLISAGAYSFIVSRRPEFVGMPARGGA